MVRRVANIQQIYWDVYKKTSICMKFMSRQWCKDYRQRAQVLIGVVLGKWGGGYIAERYNFPPEISGLQNEKKCFQAPQPHWNLF